MFEKVLIMIIILLLSMVFVKLIFIISIIYLVFCLRSFWKRLILILFRGQCSTLNLSLPLLGLATHPSPNYLLEVQEKGDLDQCGFSFCMVYYLIEFTRITTEYSRSKSKSSSSTMTMRLTVEQKCDIAQREIEELREETERAKVDFDHVLDSYHVCSSFSISHNQFMTKSIFIIRVFRL